MRPLVLLCCSIIIFLFQISEAQTHKFKNYLTLPNSTNAYIGWSLERELLLSSVNGWVKFDGLRTEFFDIHNYPQLLDHNVQSDFYTASDGKVWFCSYQTLVCFDPQNNTLDQIQISQNGRKMESDYYVFHLENDILYGAVDKVMFVFDIKAQETLFTDVKFEGNWVKFSKINDEIHLINYFRGNSTFHYILDAKTHELKSKTKLPFRTDDLNYYKNFQWILATELGLVNYNIISKAYMPSNLLAGKLLIAIGTLSENQWLCSDNEGGIYYIENEKVKKIENLLPGNPTIQHIWHHEGKIILSSYGNGVFIFSRNLILFDRSSFPTKFFPKQIFPLDNTLFIASKEYPPLKLNYDDKTLTNGFVSTKGRIMYSSLCKDGIVFNIDDGKVIFTNNKEPEFPIIIPEYIKRVKNIQYHLSEDVFTLSTFNEIVYTGIIPDNTFILLDSVRVDSSGKGIGSVILENDILIASVNDQYGIVYQKIKEKYKFKKRIDLQGTVNMKALDLKRNCIWIATQYGLKKFNFNDLSIEQVNQRYAKSSIEGLLMDDQNRLWFSTDNGLFLYDPDSELIDKFGLYDGLPDVKFTSNTACKLPNGKFLFGGSFGWVEFYPEDFIISIEKPNIVLRQTLLNDNVPVALNGKKFLSLGPDINAFSFEFSATTLLNGDENNLKYRLYPEDENFVETGSANGFARYTHLKPGKYEFQILAADEAGRWGEEGYNIELEVLPPWWATWWFRLLAIATIIALIYLSVRDYYKRQIARKDILLREQRLLIEKQVAIQQERTRIAGEMHDDLGSGLTTIKYLSDKALKNTTDEAEIENIKKISKESNHLVRNMSEIIWAMNDRFDTLDNLVIYIRRYAYEYLESRGLDFKINIQNNIPSLKISGEKRRNVFLVVKETLHNIVKHSGADFAEIEVTLDAYLNISIKDNGNHTHDEEENGLGNGLSNMKSRMEKIGGTCDIAKDKGWAVILRLPLAKE